MSLCAEIEQDVTDWINEFVAARNDFYSGKFAPCPYARGAMTAGTVDVVAWEVGDARSFIRQKASELRQPDRIQTRVIVFPPRVQWSFGISDYVDTLNMDLIADDVFLNTGVAKSTESRYAGSRGKPYFIVVANKLSEVLRGAQSLQKTNFYANWPLDQYKLVVERRAVMAARYGKS